MRLFVVVVFVSLLSACSSKFAYDNLDWWVYWYLDDYIELNNKQEEQFDSYLQKWLSWHKQSELTRYKAHLQQVKSQVINNEMDYDTIYANFDMAKAHWERVRDEISPQLAILAKELSDDQVVQLFAALEKDNKEEEKERKEKLEESAAKRLESRIERMEESVEERIGGLSQPQKQIIASYAQQFVSTSEEWLKYQRDIQNAARRIFVTRSTNTNFANDLTALMQNPEQYRSDAFKQASAHNTKLTATMMAELFTTLNAKQKEKLVEELDELIDTVNKFQR
ncbi:DUF6279 family lipoprotein [Alteromonas sp. McT4-15]|uniref:DUF6279 family lipoprotein n=1 Tax=Alteromonas sp. McT4-15 TaxID=2881256 RepID=UPI001CF8E36B|nr:DUF6279 family lipoprotein [Alteromonas sp. McT4-15]MCB4438232.1 DUF6279 family lipoprotein [Alteromonas sp. McT4-15]